MDGKHWVIIAFIAGIVALVALNRPANGKQVTTFECPPEKVCFNPSNVECYIWDMTVAGYIPLQRDKRGYVSKLVGKKHAKIKPVPDAIDCYHMEADDKLGNKVVTLPASWWKWERVR